MADDYAALMKDELEDLAGHRLNALMNIEANKARSFQNLSNLSKV